MQDSLRHHASYFSFDNANESCWQRVRPEARAKVSSIKNSRTVITASSDFRDLAQSKWADDPAPAYDEVNQVQCMWPRGVENQFDLVGGKGGTVVQRPLKFSTILCVCLPLPCYRLLDDAVAWCVFSEVLSCDHQETVSKSMWCVTFLISPSYRSSYQCQSQILWISWQRENLSFLSPKLLGY
jgi:hypothetical protein